MLTLIYRYIRSLLRRCTHHEDTAQARGTSPRGAMSPADAPSAASPTVYDALTDSPMQATDAAAQAQDRVRETPLPLCELMPEDVRERGRAVAGGAAASAKDSSAARGTSTSTSGRDAHHLASDADLSAWLGELVCPAVGCGALLSEDGGRMCRHENCGASVCEPCSSGAVCPVCRDASWFARNATLGKWMSAVTAVFGQRAQGGHAVAIDGGPSVGHGDGLHGEREPSQASAHARGSSHVRSRQSRDGRVSLAESGEAVSWDPAETNGKKVANVRTNDGDDGDDGGAHLGRVTSETKRRAVVSGNTAVKKRSHGGQRVTSGGASSSAAAASRTVVNEEEGQVVLSSDDDGDDDDEDLDHNVAIATATTAVTNDGNEDDGDDDGDGDDHDDDRSEADMFEDSDHEAACGSLGPSSSASELLSAR
jgi:hypothetical protein